MCAQLHNTYLNTFTIMHACMPNGRTDTGGLAIRRMGSISERREWEIYTML